jgi:hypothetical protein
MISTALLGVILLAPFSENSNGGSAYLAVVPGKASYVQSAALKSQNDAPASSAAVATPANQTLFGAEMEMLTPPHGLDQMVAANVAWTRRNAVPWSLVEPTEGVRDWSVLTGLESELQDASSKGIQVILIVRSTPQWARKIPGSGPSCGAVSQAKLAALGSFMHDLVARYSVPPYNVKFWELWNEPDVDPSLVQVDSVYGCWGDQNDPYYGGRYYADMLKVVYPQIKAVDPQAQVLVGGLLMDCDPRPGAGCAAVGHSIRPNKFLEGILLNNGGAYFDGVSFHAYDFYENQLGKYNNPGWQSSSSTTGPAVIAKAQFLQSVLNQYGVPGKFLMNTEVALLCDTCNNDSVYEATKAYYVAQEYAAAVALGLRANLWFTVLGWRNSGLLNSDLSPRPAYTAFQFSRNELQDAVLLRELTGYAGVKAYEFQLGNRHILVLWSLDGSVHSVTPPLPLLAAWDSLGSSVPIATSMGVGLNPLYLELNVTCGVTVSCGVTTGVFRPSNGLLYLKNSNITGFADAALNYGLPGDYPVVGDWDGNGTTTIGIYRDGYFYLRNANTIGFAIVVFAFGQPGDQPIAGDWDDDGVDTIGVFRPSNAQFMLRNSNTEAPGRDDLLPGEPGRCGDRR